MNKAFTALAASAALGLALVTVPVATAMAQDDHRNDNNRVQVQQTQHPDYSRNKYYSLGNREGYQDYQKKTQRTTHNHKYGSDNDRAAHDYGYQQGYQGQRGYKPDTDRH
jgi:hypothetical protein